MATKTVVCPDCGSPAAPGRYACADCGALLASVAAPARSWASPSAGRSVASAVVASSEAPSAVHAAPPEPEASAGIAHETAENAVPMTLPGWFAEEAVPSEPSLDPSSVEPQLTDVPTEADAVRTAPAARAAMTPAAWPPAGAADPQPPALPRTPAGAWLPPSAVLDALDVAPASTTAAQPGATRAARSWRLPARSDAFAIPADGPRGVIVAGAAVAAIGFLLPWANVLAGAGLIGGYFTQWGLAGPGHWMVLTLLAVLAIVAGSGPRTATWPVGLAGVVAAALLVGLTWPYLFGVLGRSIGVWVVLAGAVVLLLGGALDRLSRHDAEPPVVQ